MKSNCIQGMTHDEILMEFGNDDTMKKCSACSNLTYSNGIMTCELLEKGHSIPEILEIIKDEINIDRNHLYHIVYSIKTRSRWKKISEPYSF